MCSHCTQELLGPLLLTYALTLTLTLTHTDSPSLACSPAYYYTLYSLRNYLILSALDNVVSELRFWRYDQSSQGDGQGDGQGGGQGDVQGGSWSLERCVKEEGYKVVSASGVDPDESDDIWVTTDGFTQPPTLSLATASAPAVREPLKSLPAFYEATGLQTQQLHACTLTLSPHAVPPAAAAAGHASGLGSCGATHFGLRLTAQHALPPAPGGPSGPSGPSGRQRSLGPTWHRWRLPSAPPRSRPDRAQIAPRSRLDRA